MSWNHADLVQQLNEQIDRELRQKQRLLVQAIHAGLKPAERRAEKSIANRTMKRLCGHARIKTRPTDQRVWDGGQHWAVTCELCKASARIKIKK